MPTVKLSPLFNDQTSTSAGAPASGYKVHTYAAGSSSDLATYTDSTGTVQQSNPVILNSNGYPTNGPIWLQSGLAYKFILKDANDVQIGQPFDNISGINDTTASASQWISSGVTPTYVGAPSFTLSGDQTNDFHVGRRFQATVSAGTVYGTIQTSAYNGSSLTTVTASMDSGGALDAGLSAVNLSVLRADHAALPYLSVAGVQKLINGGAEVAQGAVASLSTSAQYGQVDGCTIWASTGTVGAGTITQNTSATVGRTGKAARAAGVTLTGGGVISWRCRLEALDAIKLKNQSASFQIAVMHDVGSTINYTIIIRKPTAADNYTATTTISTSSAMSVPTGTATPLAFTNVALGDCSNGLEIEVQAACGVVTTKNFDFTEWQLQEGGSATPFERRAYATELALCQRYYEEIGADALGSIMVGGWATASGQTTFITLPYKQKKRATPTIVGAGTWSAVNTTTGSPAISVAGIDSVRLAIVPAASGQFYVINDGAGAKITISARL